MITHIVLFQFKTENLQQDIAYATTQLEKLSQLQEIEGLEIGVDIPESPYSNFHVSAICKFTDMEHLTNYQKHPLHQEFGAWLKTVLVARSCVDY